MVQGVGIVAFKVKDDDGNMRVLKTRAYYVPEARVRLFSTVRYICGEKQGGSFTINPQGTTFIFPSHLGGNYYLQYI